MSTQSKIDFPLGLLILTASQDGLVSIKYTQDQSKDYSNDYEHPVLKEARDQLKGYFSGELKTFDLPLDFRNHSDFHLAVWKKVAEIPYGSTSSYQSIADALNNPGSVRAVGAANGKNPWPIVVPCHRVVGSDGSLTGYAYGLEMKQWLLEWEWQHRDPPMGKLF